LILNEEITPVVIAGAVFILLAMIISIRVKVIAISK
jgi:hypothetical protein